MRTLRIVLLQILFFVLIFLSTHLLSDFTLIKRMSYLCLTIWLSYILIKYLCDTTSKLKYFLINLFSLFLLFEFMKTFEFLLGLLPMYLEDLFMSVIGSLVCIALYLAFLVLICRLIRISKIKENKN